MTFQVCFETDFLSAFDNKRVIRTLIKDMSVFCC